MRYARIATLDKQISRLVQGTLGIAQQEPREVESLLDAVFERGCTAIDTASVYGAGAAERLLGNWLKRRGIRDRVVIIDKGCHPRGAVARMTPESLQADLQASLSRLGVREIDLFLLHRDDPSVPVGEIVDALDEQRRRGNILAFGASNWTHERIGAANTHAAQRGYTGFVVSSPGFSLAQAESSWPGCVTLSLPQHQAAVDWYRERRLPLLCWSPLASGFLADRIPLLPSDGESWQTRTARDFYVSNINIERLARTRELATRRGVTSSQIALAYVFAQPLDAFAVVGCQTAEEYEECAAALSVALSPTELRWLEVGADSARGPSNWG